jgi:hypothetical protein
MGCISNLPPYILSFGEGWGEAIEIRKFEMRPCNDTLTGFEFLKLIIKTLS